MSNSTCGNDPGAQVQLTIPSGGTVLVSASVGVGIYHATTNYGSSAGLWLGNTSTDCSSTSVSLYAIPDTAGTGFYETELNFVRVWNLGGAGTYTFYLNGESAGSNTDYADFGSVTLVASFYPA